MDITQVKKALPIILESSVTPMFVGERGVGKTQVISDFCKENGYFFHPLYLGQMADSGDVIGLQEFQRDDKGNAYATKHVMMKWMYDAIRFCEENPDKYAVIFLDEFNRASKDILQAMFNFILLGELNGVKVPSNMKPIAAQNPPTEDYDVLDMDDSALHDRFMFIPFNPTPKVFFEYAKQKGINPAIIEFLREDTKSLEPQGKDYSLDEFVKPSRRSWEKFAELEKLVNESSLSSSDKNNILLEFGNGLIGPTVAMNYIAFNKNYDRAIDAKLILKDYAKVKDKVQKAVSAEVVRTDLIKNAADNLKELIDAKTKPITKKEEQNIADFLCDLIHDNTIETAYSIFLDYMQNSENFLCTTNNKEHGMADNQQILDALDPYMDVINKTKKVDEAE